MKRRELAQFFSKSMVKRIGMFQKFVKTKQNKVKFFKILQYQSKTNVFVSKCVEEKKRKNETSFFWGEKRRKTNLIVPQQSKICHCYSSRFLPAPLLTLPTNSTPHTSHQLHSSHFHPSLLKLPTFSQFHPAPLLTLPTSTTPHTSYQHHSSHFHPAPILTLLFTLPASTTPRVLTLSTPHTSHQLYSSHFHPSLLTLPTFSHFHPAPLLTFYSHALQHHFSHFPPTPFYIVPVSWPFLYTVVECFFKGAQA